MKFGTTFITIILLSFIIVLRKTEGCQITAFTWTVAKSIHQSGRQGGKFVGNQVKVLMNSIDKLEEILFEAKVLEECQPMVDALYSIK